VSIESQTPQDFEVLNLSTLVMSVSLHLRSGLRATGWSVAGKTNHGGSIFVNDLSALQLLSSFYHATSYVRRCNFCLATMANAIPSCFIVHKHSVISWLYACIYRACMMLREICCRSHICIISTGWSGVLKRYVVRARSDSYSTEEMQTCGAALERQ
jgi:hypothetical protein